MFFYSKKIKSGYIYRIVCGLIVTVLSFSLTFGPSAAYAQSVFLSPLRGFNLPVVGTMIVQTPAFSPAIIRGLSLHPENPLEFDFIVDRGDDYLEGEELQKESLKMIKYFLAALTVPKDEMWVNLSPYEKDRIIPQGFGVTEMGRDLLAQDYLLKQLTASLMYPEDELGQKFWKRVYKKAYEQFGTTEIPMDTFNKVWIVPDKAVVYEHENNAFVINRHLKVMLEEDYLAREASLGNREVQNLSAPRDTIYDSQISKEIIKEILIPEIEKEVNKGETFANLRQVYNSMILAIWYKQKLKDSLEDYGQTSLLSQVYVDQNKTKGVDVKDKEVKQKIYDQYIEAFKKGVYNYIKEDLDPATQEIIPRKYFSGGTTAPEKVETRTSASPLSLEEQRGLNEYLARSKDGFDTVNVQLLEANGKTVELVTSGQAISMFNKPFVRLEADQAASPISLSGMNTEQDMMDFQKVVAQKIREKYPIDFSNWKLLSKSFELGDTLEKIEAVYSSAGTAGLWSLILYEQQFHPNIEELFSDIKSMYLYLSQGETIRDLVESKKIKEGPFTLGTILYARLNDISVAPLKDVKEIYEKFSKADLNQQKEIFSIFMAVIEVLEEDSNENQVDDSVSSPIDAKAFSAENFKDSKLNLNDREQSGLLQLANLLLEDKFDLDALQEFRNNILALVKSLEDVDESKLDDLQKILDLDTVRGQFFVSSFQYIWDKENQQQRDILKVFLAYIFKRPESLDDTFHFLEHSIAVALYHEYLGTRIELSDEEITDGITAGLLHDLGKIYSSQTIALHNSEKFLSEMSEEERMLTLNHEEAPEEMLAEYGLSVSHAVLDLVKESNTQKISGKIVSLNVATLFMADQFDGRMDLLRNYRRRVLREQGLLRPGMPLRKLIDHTYEEIGDDPKFVMEGNLGNLFEVLGEGINSQNPIIYALASRTYSLVDQMTPLGNSGSSSVVQLQERNREIREILKTKGTQPEEMLNSYGYELKALLEISKESLLEGQDMSETFRDIEETIKWITGKLWRLGNEASHPINFNFDETQVLQIVKDMDMELQGDKSINKNRLMSYWYQLQIFNEIMAKNELWKRVPGAKEAKNIIKKLNSEFKKRDISEASLADKPVQSISNYLLREFVERGVIDIEKDMTMFIDFERVLKEKNDEFKALLSFEYENWRVEDLSQWMYDFVLPLRDEILDLAGKSLMKNVKNKDFYKKHRDLKKETIRFFDSIVVIHKLRMGLSGVGDGSLYRNHKIQMKEGSNAISKANHFLAEFLASQGGVPFRKKYRENFVIWEGAPEEINKGLRDFYLETISGEKSVPIHLFSYDEKQNTLYLRPSEKSSYIAVIQKTGESGDSFNLKTLQFSASSPVVSEVRASDERQETVDFTKGGIDFNPDLLDLQIKRDGNGVPLPLPQQPIGDMQIEGFLPVIINIMPAANIPFLLGLVDTEEESDDSAYNSDLSWANQKKRFAFDEVEVVSVLN